MRRAHAALPAGCLRGATGRRGRRPDRVLRVTGIESLRRFAKQRLAQSHSSAPHTLHLHVKECEWRFNTPRAARERTRLRLLREHPL